MDLKLFKTVNYCIHAVRDSVWLNKALDRFDALVFALTDLRTPKDPNKPDIVELESRILYSASPFPVFDASQAPEALGEFECPPQIDQEQWNSHLLEIAASSTSDSLLQIAEAIKSARSAEVDSADDRSNGFDDGFDGDGGLASQVEDGFDQVEHLLASLDAPTDANIVLHGTDGTDRLGSKWVFYGNGENENVNLHHLGILLDEAGSTQVYGCGVSNLNRGETLLEAVSAAVAEHSSEYSATDGHAGNGGATDGPGADHWSLSSHLNEGETLNALKIQSQSSYDGLLANYDVAGQQTVPDRIGEQLASHELVFLQAGLLDTDSLIADLEAQANTQGRWISIVVLDGMEDGFAQIDNALTQIHDLNAIHIVSHGSDGMIQLGSSWLTSANLQNHLSDLRQWGMALEDDGDILIYGCDVAAGADGQGLIDSVARLTGADVAASTNKTGNLSRGGDWVLEYESNQSDQTDPTDRYNPKDPSDPSDPSDPTRIQTRIAFGLSLQESYAGLLATYTVTNTNDSGAGSLRQAILDANSNAGTDTILFDLPTDATVIYLENALPLVTDVVAIQYIGPANLLLLGNTQTPVSTIAFAPGSEGSQVNGIDFASIYAGTNGMNPFNATISLAETMGPTISASLASPPTDETILDVRLSTEPTQTLDSLAVQSQPVEQVGVTELPADNATVLTSHANLKLNAVTSEYFRIDPNDWQLDGHADAHSPVGSVNDVDLEHPFIESVERFVAGGSVEQLSSIVPAPEEANKSPQDYTDTLSPIDIGAEGTHHEVVFVQAGLYDSESLIAELEQNASISGRDLVVVVLNGTENGFDQINSVLSQYTNLDAIHIVSHGTDGMIQLGGSWLTAGNVLDHGIDLQKWGMALNADGDILIYGCDVAAGADGKALIDTVARLTSSDVAASTDKTGNLSRGGDWELEYVASSYSYLSSELTSSTNFGSDSSTGVRIEYLNERNSSLSLPSNLQPPASSPQPVIQTQIAFGLRLQESWGGLLAIYTVTNTNDSGAGSLRQAIIDANANSGADTINFNITGTGVHTITPTTAMTTITGQVTIDATTDDSYAVNGNKPAIILDGNNLVADGFTLSSTADGSIIRGFVIRDFAGDGIEIQANSDGNTVAGNYIGRLNSSGTDGGAGEENTGSGVRVLGANNVIGGTGAFDRNVIAGNADGIYITGASATGNILRNNYIGVDVTGATARANSGIGVYVDSGASSNTIGSAGYGNVISGNTNVGISISGATTSNNTIQSNYIGLNAAGSAAVSNGAFGIVVDFNASGTLIGTNVDGTNDAIEGNVISGNTGSTGSTAGGGIYLYATNTNIRGNIIGLDATGTTAIANGRAVTNSAGIYDAGGSTNINIGGTAAYAGNTISSNTGDGIIINNTGISILGNSIWGNSQQGIDLANDGINVNDFNDVDSGANGLQNFPRLKSATSSAGNTTITGAINTTASTTYRIEFFSTAYGSANASGYGGGKTYIGSTSVTTDSAGNATFSTLLSGVSLTTGSIVTATATVDLGGGSYGSTSEFAGSILANASNLMITGSYTGNGTDDRTISGLGFRPEAVMILPESSSRGVLRTSSMSGDASKILNYTSAGLSADLIQSLTGDGFTIGTNASVNTNAVVYHWIAWGAGADITVGSYTGNGTSQSINGVGFQAEMMLVAGASSSQAAMRSSLSTSTWDFGNSAGVATAVTTLNSDGFSVGASALANSSSTVYHYVAFNQNSSYLSLGTYVGNATDNRNNTGVGFEPEFVFTKKQSAADFGGFKTESSGYATDKGLFADGFASAANYIQALQSDGFQIGTGNEVNNSGATYGYFAFRQNDAPLIVDTTSDTSDGTVASINALRANKGADGKISLREAIAATNAAHNGTIIDEIDFNIGSGGLQTITVGSTALPSITDAVKIDAWNHLVLSVRH